MIIALLIIGVLLVLYWVFWLVNALTPHAGYGYRLERDPDFNEIVRKHSRFKSL